MEDLCKLLQISWDEKCVNWMHNAVEHCSEVMYEYKTPDSDLWTAMSSAFASGNGFISDMKLGPDSNPQELSFGECSTILTTIARDYFVRWPYIQIMEIMTIGSWTIMLGFVGIISMFALLFAVFYLKQKLDNIKLWNNLSSSSDALYQKQTNFLKNLDESSVKNSATKTIVINVTNGVGDGISNSFGNIEPIEIFYLLCDGIINFSKELPYKRATIEEVLNFLESYPNKLSLVLLFDDIKLYNEFFKRCLMRFLEEKSPKQCSRSPSRLSLTSSATSRSRIPVPVSRENSCVPKSSN